ncbi:hypothetical protein PM082_000506 [Marasmius tenuissimus]|nr:hypothetical protein PM082_000506 [Marasmius tenuissimus]
MLEARVPSPQAIFLTTKPRIYFRTQPSVLRRGKHRSRNQRSVRMATIESIRPRQAADGMPSISPVKYFLLIHYGPERQEVKKVKGDPTGRKWEVGLEISRVTDPAGIFIEVRRNCVLSCFRSLLATGNLTIDKVEEVRRTAAGRTSIRVNSKSDTYTLDFKLTPVPLTRVHQSGSAHTTLQTVPSTPSTSRLPSRTPFRHGASSVPTILEHSHPPPVTYGSQLPRVPVIQLPPLSTSAGHSGLAPIPPPDVPVSAGSSKAGDIADLTSIPSISRASSRAPSRLEVVSLTESMNFRSSPSRLSPRAQGVSDTPPSSSTSVRSKAVSPVAKTVLQDSPTPMNDIELPSVPPTGSPQSGTTIIALVPEFPNGVLPPAGRGPGPTHASVTSLSSTLPPPSSVNSSEVKSTEMARRDTGTPLPLSTRRSSSQTSFRPKGKSVDPRASEVDGLHRPVPVTPAPKFSKPPPRRSDTARSSEKLDSSQMRATDTGRPGTSPPLPPHSSPPVSRRSSSRLSSRRVPVPALELEDPLSLPDKAHPEHVAVVSPLPIRPPTGLVSREPPRGKRTGTIEEGARSPSTPPPLSSRRSSSKPPSRRDTPVSEPETSPSVLNGTHRHVPVIPSPSSTLPPRHSETARPVKETVSRTTGETKVARQHDSPSSTPPISRNSSKRSAHGTWKSTGPVLERDNLPSKPDRSHQHVPVAPSSSSGVPPGPSSKEPVFSDLTDARRPDTPSSWSSTSRSSSRRSTRRAAPAQDLKDRPPLLNGSSRRPSNSSTTSRTTSSLKKAFQAPPSGTNTEKEVPITRPTSKKPSQHEPTFTLPVTNGSRQQRTPPTGRSGSVPALKDSMLSNRTNGRNHRVDPPVVSPSSRHSSRRGTRNTGPESVMTSDDLPVVQSRNPPTRSDSVSSFEKGWF